MENSLFPIKLGIHIVFALAALLVFGLQFLRYRKKYHLVLAIAIPLSLLPYLAEDNMPLFYAVGVVDALALIGALILAKTVDRDPEAETDAEPAAEEAAPEEAAEASAAPEETADAEAEETVSDSAQEESAE